jgi:hypothetical protein
VISQLLIFTQKKHSKLRFAVTVSDLVPRLQEIHHGLHLHGRCDANGLKLGTLLAAAITGFLAFTILLVFSDLEMRLFSKSSSI